MTNTLNFGLAEALHAIRESKAYSNHKLRYSVDQISRNYSVGYKEHQLVEGFLSAMKPYLWDETVSALVAPVMEAVAQKADRLAALHLYETLSAYDRMGFMKDATNCLIQFVNEKKTSAELISALGKFSYDGRVKSFCNSMLLKENKNMDIQRSTDTCEVSDVYSPVFESGNTTFFSANKTYFAKSNTGLQKLSNSEVDKLPVKFRDAVDLFNSNDVKIVEGRIVYRIGKDKYEFIVEGASLKATLNGKVIAIDSVEHMAEFSAKSIFEGKSNKRMKDMETIRDWATRLVKVDGVKVLESKVYTGLTATVFNVDEQLYVHAVNEGMRSNEFGKMTATAAINKIRKELRFDISKSFAGMLLGEAKRMSDLGATAVKINENIVALENKIASTTNINESVDVDNAIEALRDALNKERAQYNQVNREITEIESAISEEDDMNTDEPVQQMDLAHVDEDAIKVGDMVETAEGKTGKVTGFSEEGGEATVVLDGGEVIHPMVADLKKVQDDLENAIAANDCPVEESEYLDTEEEENAGTLVDDAASMEVMQAPEEVMPPTQGAVPTQATLVISVGPYDATSVVEIDAEEFASKSDNDNITIKNPIDGIDLIPKKYLKVAGVVDGVNNATEPLPVATIEVDEANKTFSSAHPDLGGKVDFKVNTMGRVEGTHKMADFLAFLDKHVGDKKITNKTQYAGAEEEHEIYGDPKFFVVIDGEIEEGFVDERDANNLVDQLKTMKGGDEDGMSVVPRAELDVQDVNDYLATLDKGEVEESENHVDNSDMTLHDVMGMVMGEDHGITEEEILSQFSGEEVQLMKDFIRNHQDLIKKLNGIPYDGESEEWDQIKEQGKELLGKLLDAYEEAAPEDQDEQSEETETQE